MTDDRPVDVRLAEALGEYEGPGHGGHDYPDPDGTSDCSNGCGCWMGPYNSGGPRGVDPFGECPKSTPDPHHYSSDYAWCGEVADLNNLVVKRCSPTDHMCWNPYGSQTSVISDLGWRIAICEWVIAAVAAGVRVVLPGGRVIEGRAA